MCDLSVVILSLSLKVCRKFLQIPPSGLSRDICGEQIPLSLRNLEKVYV